MYLLVGVGLSLTGRVMRIRGSIANSRSRLTGSASWWFRAGRHHQCKDVLFDGRAGRVISAGEQG
jgi:hypothetical protein